MSNYSIILILLVVIVLIIITIYTINKTILLTTQTEHPTKEQICEIKYSSIKKNDKEIEIGCTNSNAKKIREFAKRNEIEMKISNETKEQYSFDQHFKTYNCNDFEYEKIDITDIIKIYYITFSARDVNAITNHKDIETIKRYNRSKNSL